MGNSFYYSGSLPDNRLQLQVINLVISYFGEISLYLNPDPGTEYMTEYDTGKPKLYPFNFFGVVPLLKDSLIEHGQFVFDRDNGGTLVRFHQLPAFFNIPPWDNEINQNAEVVLQKKGYMRGEYGLDFALLLNLIKIKWWPEFKFGDDYDTCEEVYNEIVGDAKLHSAIRKKALEYNEYLNLYLQSLRKRQPPSFRQKQNKEPESDPSPEPQRKPVLRVVPSNPAEVTIEEMDLRIRTYKFLKRAGINTLADILKYSESELKRLNPRHCTRLTLKEIRETVLRDYGYYLH
ncbi:DNA-directed RNA polymerase subunit alpha C-terminal domain-containing protein [Dethiobacter alkaliphilus]|uniref:DNA-directed RNA polymerase subunit alpha C-terminal domain-containing protein n=1 Tax=Dethiobacter alkaliphilus TaxID=427926 RepID=UPI0022274D33|nr:DNA-directed RNA polymerase subunit alpha C-terminal domain-containing protein [Dethiobacter alkaliphilus]MCW3488697.1 hypothetical protein [Dethiobacter alkaliphilus]